MRKASPAKKARMARTANASSIPKQANLTKGAQKAPLKANFVVGIGASAGGLEALQTFVSHLPESAAMTYVIAQHLSPQHRSMMVELLARHSPIPVHSVTDGTVPQANIIYVTPPDQDVLLRDGRLRLRKPQATIGPKPSVDYFFTTLANELHDRSIGLVLSGTGSDGSHGMRAIKAAGGITIAQEPKCCCSLNFDP